MSKYVCNNCGSIFDRIPEVYRGFSGDHFGGSRTIWPGCSHCAACDFTEYSDVVFEEVSTLRKQVKVLREACQSGIDALTGIMNHYGTGLQVINWHLNGDSEPFDNFIDYAGVGCALDSLSGAIEQTKPKDDV